MSIRIDHTTDMGMQVLVRISLVSDYKALLNESIVMATNSLENIDTERFFDKLKFGSKRVSLSEEIKASLFAEFEDINADLQKNESRASIIKTFFYNAIENILRYYYIADVRDWESHELDNENFPLYMTENMRKFTIDYLPLFEQIVQYEGSCDLADIIDAEPVAPITKAVYGNIYLILAEIFLGKLKTGKNITKKLFQNLPQHERKIPQRFLAICETKGNKLYLKNADIDSIAVILCVMDCIDFNDIEHKRLFNNRMNSLISL